MGRRARPTRLVAIKSCNQGFWRDDLVRVNGFDEDFVGWGPEDKELCARLEHAGVRRQTLLFGGIACHLHHAPASRDRLPANLARLAATRRERRVRCEHGLDSHLARLRRARKCVTWRPQIRRSRMPGKSMPGKLILVRHGQSTWNVENLFTGWHDVDLSDQGRIEARSAGVEIRKAGLVPDIAFTSVLKRAIRTLWIVLDEMDLMWLPVERSWRLNERHYGALQGLDKAQTVEKHGEAQVKIWRRSYDIPPPPLELDDPRHPVNDRRYANLDPRVLPASESLKDTLARVLPFWNDRIVAELKAGKNVLVAAHGNSLRAMVKMLDNVSEADITELNIPTGVPLVYELDADLKPIRSGYLGDPEAIKAAAEAVKKQTEKKK